MQDGVLRTWAVIMAKLLSNETNIGVPNRFYIEFFNITEPEDPTTTPTFEVDDGIDYYVDLASDPCIDFVRAPVDYIKPFISDPTLFSKPNAITVFTSTTETEGIHGKPFTSGAISKIIGGAIVHAPDDDYTNDIVLCRFYLDSEDQPVRPSGQPFAVSKSLILGTNP